MAYWPKLTAMQETEQYSQSCVVALTSASSHKETSADSYQRTLAGKAGRG